MTDLLSTVDGLLIDIDGVLLLGNEVLPGATAVIDTLRARQIPFRFMTNTTIYCRYTLLEHLNAKGFTSWFGSIFVMLTGFGLFELCRRQFLQQWGRIQEDIEHEIKRAEAL